jgi:hypothetical protein
MQSFQAIVASNSKIKAHKKNRGGFLRNPPLFSNLRNYRGPVEDEATSILVISSTAGTAKLRRMPSSGNSISFT